MRAVGHRCGADRRGHQPRKSGGALVDLTGKVVGLDSAIATAGGGSTGNIGVGFAIPSDTVAEIAAELVADGTADHSQLGVGLGQTQDGSGAVLTRVSGPAAAAGLQAGNVVTRVTTERRWARPLRSSPGRLSR